MKTSARFGLVLLASLASACLFACSPSEAPTRSEESGELRSELPDPGRDRLARMREARKNLASFYLRTFAGMIQGGHYERDLPIMKFDQYAHRLWVPERDWTYEQALEILAGRVVAKDVEVKSASGETEFLRAAHFTDDDQLHRDQYATIFSEMDLESLGSTPLDEFVLASKLDYMSGALSQRIERAWTLALLVKRTAHGAQWRNVRGEKIDVARIADDMIGAPFFPDERDKFACYDYHGVYGLAAAAEGGYAAFGPVARTRMRRAFETAREVCAASIEKGDAMEEVIGRIKLNGHLLEAYFRGGEGVFASADFAAHVDRAIDGLLADSALIADLTVYEGPPDILVSVPHAIHGLDMGFARLGSP